MLDQPNCEDVIRQRPTDSLQWCVECSGSEPSGIVRHGGFQVFLLGMYGDPEDVVYAVAAANAAPALLARAEAAEAERDKLQAFKDWVHAYLDTHGVPHHPPGTHGAAGCRIGDRMDWLMAERDRLRTELAAAREALRKVEWIHDAFDDETHCHVCNGSDGVHRQTCRLAAVLKGGAK